jgi:hypothetical protein
MHYSSSSSHIHLSTVVILLGVCISGFVSILYFNQSDPQGCQVSPDNSGCVLNRPVDIQRQQEIADRQSQDLLFRETL